MLVKILILLLSIAVVLSTTVSCSKGCGKTTPGGGGTKGSTKTPAGPWDRITDDSKDVTNPDNIDNMKVLKVFGDYYMPIEQTTQNQNNPQQFEGRYARVVNIDDIPNYQLYSYYNAIATVDPATNSYLLMDDPVSWSSDAESDKGSIDSGSGVFLRVSPFPRTQIQMQSDSWDVDPGYVTMDATYSCSATGTKTDSDGTVSAGSTTIVLGEHVLYGPKSITKTCLVNSNDSCDPSAVCNLTGISSLIGKESDICTLYFDHLAIDMGKTCASYNLSSNPSCENYPHFFLYYHCLIELKALDVCSYDMNNNGEYTCPSDIPELCKTLAEFASQGNEAEAIDISNHSLIFSNSNVCISAFCDAWEDAFPECNGVVDVDCLHYEICPDMLPEPGQTSGGWCNPQEMIDGEDWENIDHGSLTCTGDASIGITAEMAADMQEYCVNAGIMTPQYPASNCAGVGDPPADKMLRAMIVNIVEDNQVDDPTQGCNKVGRDYDALGEGGLGMMILRPGGPAKGMRILGLFVDNSDGTQEFEDKVNECLTGGEFRTRGDGCDGAPPNGPCKTVGLEVINLTCADKNLDIIPTFSTVNTLTFDTEANTTAIDDALGEFANVNAQDFTSEEAGLALSTRTFKYYIVPEDGLMTEDDLLSGETANVGTTYLSLERDANKAEYYVNISSNVTVTQLGTIGVRYKFTMGTGASAMEIPMFAMAAFIIPAKVYVSPMPTNTYVRGLENVNPDTIPDLNPKRLSTDKFAQFETYYHYVQIGDTYTIDDKLGDAEWIMLDEKNANNYPNVPGNQTKLYAYAESCKGHYGVLVSVKTTSAEFNDIQFKCGTMDQSGELVGKVDKKWTKIGPASTAHQYSCQSEDLLTADCGSPEEGNYFSAITAIWAGFRGPQAWNTGQDAYFADWEGSGHETSWGASADCTDGSGWTDWCKQWYRWHQEFKYNRYHEGTDSQGAASPAEELSDDGGALMSIMLWSGGLDGDSYSTSWTKRDRPAYLNIGCAETTFGASSSTNTKRDGRVGGGQAFYLFGLEGHEEVQEADIQEVGRAMMGFGCSAEERISVWGTQVVPGFE